MNNVFKEKVESAREIYSMKFLEDKFKNKEDNIARKDKLQKLMEKLSNDQKGTINKDLIE